jgi:hypothetical protein
MTTAFSHIKTDTFFVTYAQQTLKVYMQNVEKINALEDAYEKLTNEQLRAKSDDFRKKLRFVCSFFLIFLLIYLFFVIYFIFGLLFICIENNNNSNVNYSDDDNSDNDDNNNNIT